MHISSLVTWKGDLQDQKIRKQALCSFNGCLLLVHTSAHPSVWRSPTQVKLNNKELRWGLGQDPNLQPKGARFHFLLQSPAKAVPIFSPNIFSALKIYFLTNATQAGFKDTVWNGEGRENGWICESNITKQLCLELMGQPEQRKGLKLEFSALHRSWLHRGSGLYVSWESRCIPKKYR